MRFSISRMIRCRSQAGHRPDDQRYRRGSTRMLQDTVSELKQYKNLSELFPANQRKCAPSSTSAISVCRTLAERAADCAILSHEATCSGCLQMMGKCHCQQSTTENQGSSAIWSACWSARDRQISTLSLVFHFQESGIYLSFRLLCIDHLRVRRFDQDWTSVSEIWLR